MRVRKFKKEDAVKASNIVKQGFEISNARFYKKNSIAEQVESNSPKNLIEKAKKIHYFVAVEKAEILGIGGYDTKKVHTLFVDPKHQGKGIGKKLIERILSEAKKNGIKILDSWSTFQAEKFYAKAGFKRIKIFTLQCRHSSIDFVLMRKNMLQ